MRQTNSWQTIMVFICAVSEYVFTAYLHSNRGGNSSFAIKNFIFCGISTVVFRVSNSVCVFRLGESGKARFFSSVRTICRF